MREFFSDKTFKAKKLLLLSKFILVAALLIFFIPLIILPFYNHPFADDYFCGYYLNSKSLLSYQLFIYQNWGGRFAATFTGSLFAYHNFLYGHYYMHSLFLLGLNCTSTFFLTNVFCKWVLDIELKFSTRLLFTFLFVALEICSLPQPSTYLFWFSSAVTYHLPVTFIEIEIALCILLHYNSFKYVAYVLLPLLVFIIAGFNELFIITQLFLFIALAWLKWHKKFSIFFFICLIALSLSSALVLFAPGNQVRSHEIASKSFFTGSIACIYHCAETMWYIFKNPLFWFSAIFVLIYGGQVFKNHSPAVFIQKLYASKWQVIFFVAIVLIVMMALPVAALKGGIIPDRYVNAVVAFMLILLLLFFLVMGINIRSAFISQIKKSFAYLLLAIGLLCNNYVVDAYKSLIIAPVYCSILNEREAVLKQAAISNKVAIVKNYDVALSNLIQTKYSSTSLTYQQLIQQKPPLLFFEDDLATEASILVLKNYYKLDSIKVQEH